MEEKPEIKILKVVRLQGKGPLRGFVDIAVGSWVVNDWRIIEKQGEALQVSYPLVSYRDKNGTVRYRSLLTLPAPLKAEIDFEILVRWKHEDNHGSYTPNK